MTNSRKHHPHACLERITLPREHGGRGIVDIKNLCYRQIEAMRKYFYDNERRPLHQTVINADENHTPLNLQNRCYDPGRFITTDSMKTEEWARKELHGRFYANLHSEHVDRQASLTWLAQGKLNPETEGFMLAIQDQVIKTNNYARYILKEPIKNDECRRCHTQRETIDHIISACPNLARTKYIERHNLVAKIVHQELMRVCNLGNLASRPYYQYTPSPVEESDEYRMYWDKDIITDVRIDHNRPDITLIDKRKRIAYLIDIAVPNNNNLLQKHREKLDKYEMLRREVKEMWHMDTVKIIPLIISSMGLVPKNLKDNLRELNLPFSIHSSMQKAIVLQTTSIVRSFLG